ncbi:MAG TPA: MarR family transcriptional regulator [Acidimicrobiales bacterium]|nr:MarR family transcriptional regulator [Acidimicrobiales bacterium]
MAAEDQARGNAAERPPLGGALRQAWVGYRVRLDAEMAAAGFADSGLPDGRILHICAARDGVTISDVGRELGITRQGASKAVARLHERGYVELRPSPEDGREKVAGLTGRAQAYLAAQRRANRKIARGLRAEVGDDAIDALYRLLDALGTEDVPRLRDYLRTAGTRE